MKLDFFYPDLIQTGQIIGIIEDFYLSGLDYEITPMVIFPKHTWLYCFSVKIDGDHKAAINHLQIVWDDLFPDFPLSYYFTDELINEYYSTELTEIKIRLIFSLLSVFIAGTGLFALSGFFMNRKLKYAAIKKVHGASVSDILIPELLYYFYIAFIASAIAVLPSYFLMERWLRNFYYKLKIPFYIFIVCALILVLFSWISVIFHSMKLARLNPVETMKD